MLEANGGPGSVTPAQMTQLLHTTGSNNGLDSTNTYFSNVYPGLVWEPNTKPFTLGNPVGLGAGDVVVNFSNQAPLPSVGGQWWTTSLSFPNNNFTSGNELHFTVGHGPPHNRQVTNGTGQDGDATSISLTWRISSAVSHSCPMGS